MHMCACIHMQLAMPFFDPLSIKPVVETIKITQIAKLIHHSINDLILNEKIREKKLQTFFINNL